MAKIEFQFEEYESRQNLPESYKTLLEKATDALEKAYAPYSEFCVGSAVQLSNGAIITGANMENASFPVGICAEKATLAAAQSQYPGEDIELLAITVKSRRKRILKPAAPCGSCRQFIFEKEELQGQPIKLILQGSEGPVWVIDSVADLLPLYFDRTFLDDHIDPR